jgi:hypothetical protein
VSKTQGLARPLELGVLDSGLTSYEAKLGWGRLSTDHPHGGQLHSVVAQVLCHRVAAVQLAPGAWNRPGQIRTRTVVPWSSSLELTGSALKRRHVHIALEAGHPPADLGCKSSNVAAAPLTPPFSAGAGGCHVSRVWVPYRTDGYRRRGALARVRAWASPSLCLLARTVARAHRSAR